MRKLERRDDRKNSESREYNEKYDHPLKSALMYRKLFIHNYYIIYIK